MAANSSETCGPENIKTCIVDLLLWYLVTWTNTCFLVRKLAKLRITSLRITMVVKSHTFWHALLLSFHFTSSCCRKNFIALFFFDYKTLIPTEFARDLFSVKNKTVKLIDSTVRLCLPVWVCMCLREWERGRDIWKLVTTD